MSWFDSIKSPKLKTTRRPNGQTPAGLWQKCVKCQEILQVEKLEKNQQVCPYCDHHYRVSARRRIEFLSDEGSFQERDIDLCSQDPLQFTDRRPYNERLVAVREKNGEYDSVIYGEARVHDNPVVLCVMDFFFMGGSMGVVAGEKIARAMELSLEKKVPMVMVSCSGGARMQEGILSLMQMAKTSAVRSQLRRNGIPYISVLTDPTTGGVAASFASTGDVIIAEPEALIGFAGPRVIEQSIRQKLPEGFQRSEFLQDHGLIDSIVHRRDLAQEIAFYASFLSATPA